MDLRSLFLLSAIGLINQPVFARDPDGWNQLKLGMTSPEALEALGDPLLKSVGRGFELWIYDRHAEVLFYGGVGIGWTTPKSQKTGKRVADVWQYDQGWLQLPPFTFPLAPRKTISPWRDLNAYRHEQLPTYGPRIRR